MLAELADTRERRLDALMSVPLDKLCTSAGIASEVAEKLSAAKCNTNALISLAGAADVGSFEIAVQSMLTDEEKLLRWQVFAIFGYIQTRLTEINSLTVTTNGEPPKVETEKKEVKKEAELKTSAQVQEEEMNEYMLLVQGELGIKSLSVSMAVLKGLLTEVGPTGITIKEKVAKVIVQARRGVVQGQELVMQVSGSGEVVPKMAVGMGTRVQVWQLARKNWAAFITFTRRVRKILSRADPDGGEDAVCAWEAFVEHLGDLEEIHGADHAAEYFVQFTTEYDFCFSDDEGKIRKADDDKIVMVTRRALKSAKPRREEDDFRKDKKERQEKKPSEGPCLKCGGKHGIFSCKERCKKIGYCVVCGEDRKECPNMWECSERHADSK